MAGLAKHASRMDDTGLADAPLHNDLNTGPGTGSTRRPSVPPDHTDSHRRLNSLPAQPVENRKRKTKEPCSKGYKNDADRSVCHAAYQLSRKTDKVYAGETPADQESR